MRRRLPFALVAALAWAGAHEAPPVSKNDAAARAAETGDAALVQRGLVVLRLDPKLGSAPGECDELAAADLRITVAGIPVPVGTVEHVPRPERHWLLLDVSGSAGERRREAQRSARQYIREVLVPEVDSAALLTVSDDTILIGGPTTDAKGLAALVEDVPEGGGSALRDGLATVLRQIEGDRHEHLVLFWTDGRDTQSALGVGDLMATLERTPNATVVPIALIPGRRPASGESPVGAFLFDVAKASGGGVFSSTDARWLDHVRGWIARRFVVSFTPPEGKPAGKLAIDLPGRRCTATVLPDPFERPDAIAGVAPPAPRAWVRLHATQRKNDDPACAGGPTDAPWDWPLRPDAAHLTGCVLDVVQAPGALRRAPGGKKPRTLDFAPMRLAAREVTIEAPHVDRLPENLAEALDALSRSDTAAPGARSPRIVEGSALLTQRARIAASLYAARADYFAFAKAQLAELADADLSAAERDLRRAFPDLAATQITAAARASRAGRRALESVRRPTDADMARVLAAWLGDTPAWMAFRDWELLLVDARLAGPADPGVLARWGAMRARFGQTDSIRIAAPLVLLHDRGRDLIGFRRIVLPLPIDLDEAVRRPDAWDKRVEDRLPDRPFALDVLEAALADPDAAARIAAGAFHAIDVTYRPLEPAAKTVQSGPFRHCRVRVDLEGAAARLRLESEVTFADDGALRVEPPDATFTPR